MPVDSYTYIGRKPCGCAVAATVDDGSKRTAKDVAEFITNGLVVERVATEDLHPTAEPPKIKMGGCRHAGKIGAPLL